MGTTKGTDMLTEATEVTTHSAMTTGAVATTDAGMDEAKLTGGTAVTAGEIMTIMIEAARAVTIESA